MTTLDERIANLESPELVEQVKRWRTSRERLSSDRHRPTFHFSPPENFMNDPNGLCQWKGLYHLFYQFRGDGEDRVHWGHAVSEDLVRWKDLPIALYPDQEHDVFSGQTLVEDDRVIAAYHGTQAGNAIATASDYLLIDWKKNPNNPVIPIVPFDEETGAPYRVFDPCIWKEDDGYYALSGTFKNGERSIDCEGVDHLFHSTDLTNWEYLGELISANRISEPGEDYAVPNFWPIGNGKHMLLFFSHKRGGQYFVGDYDQANHKFTPDYHGRLNNGPLAIGSLHAPSATIDDSGRFLAIFNVKESRESQGWDDIMTLPTHLSLRDDNSLSIRPVDEIESLRGDRTTADDIEVGTGQQIVLDSIAGNAIEISMTIDPGDAHEVGLNVLRSPDAEETTRISFFPKGHQRWGSAHLQIDGSSSSIRTDLIPRPPELAPFDLSKGESINLRIFVDRSIIEVFANDMQCLTLRAYPDRDDSVGVSLFSRGGTAKFTGIESWKMECTWPELR
ncbi:MAG: glycoside hydrolase family 32 protein [Dehalococcoidia bacterium]|nr:glycoside hydrolase family 32 protein [Dehalococcoidia bacterium]